MDQLYDNLAHALYTSVGRHLRGIKHHPEFVGQLVTVLARVGNPVSEDRPS